jgi:hypothetical protein
MLDGNGHDYNGPEDAHSPRMAAQHRRHLTTAPAFTIFATLTRRTCFRAGFIRKSLASAWAIPRSGSPWTFTAMSCPTYRPGLRRALTK